MLATELSKQMVDEHVQGIRFKNVTRSALMNLSEDLDRAMGSMGYHWEDVEKAMKMDLQYIVSTMDDHNRRVDRIIRDYRFRSSSSDGGSSDQEDPTVDMSPETPKGPSSAPDSGPDPDPIAREDQDQDQDEDQDQDQDRDEPENEPEPDDDPDQDQDDEDEDDRKDPQPDPQPEPDDPNMDLIERIVRYNMDHPDNVINIMLYGPRGTAKTRMGIDVSYRVFGEPPSIMTAPQDKYEIIGYADAHGNPVPTTFIKGYTKPGILLIDEVDRMDQTAGIAMNSAISNGLLDTTYMGVLERNPQMTIIATANTAGMGASSEYVTANVMDSSIRDRFVFIPIEWDHGKALNLSPDAELVDFIERWNRACDEVGLGMASASYRALLMWASLREVGLGESQIMDYVLLKGTLDPSDLLAVYEKLPQRGTMYDTVLRRFADRARARMMML